MDDQKTVAVGHFFLDALGGQLVIGVYHKLPSAIYCRQNEAISGQIGLSGRMVHRSIVFEWFSGHDFVFQKICITKK